MQQVRSAIATQVPSQPGPITDPDDPQKYRWGGLAERNGRKLTATVTPVSPKWFRVQLEVSSTGGAPLTGNVEYHLHPSFTPSIEVVPVMEAKAELTTHAYGAFTVGAVLDNGRTPLS